MTRYAIDRARDALVAVWSTGIGDIAIVVTDDLPRDVADNDLLRLAARLTDLSQVCWRCYTHPADAADDHGPGSVGAQRQQERDAFAMILPTITAARPADGPPSTTVEHAAHAVRRALQVIDEPALAMPILADVDAELAAVEQAERGDLTERAQQAVTLSREDASPLQVSEADSLLRRQPFGSEALVTEIDPTAAAIAAAHWLYAAVTVTCRRTGMHPAQIVAAADQHTKPFAAESLADIVAILHGGGRPRPVVMSLVRNAMHVAEGHLHDIADARHRIAAAEQLIEKAEAEHPELGLTPETMDFPLTPLDPARPAPDLLENLLYGIRSCWRLFERHVTGNGRANTARTSCDVEQDEALETFLAAIRREARARGDDLL